MPDREKVINKVKAIVADMQEEVDEWKDYSDSELRGGLTCDCDWWYKTLQTLKDVLTLLKAQEPRVMTLKELEDWDGAVFFEAFETDMYYALIENVDLTAGMDGEYVLVNVVPGEHHRRIWGGEHYGEIWRCWTSRPDEKRRAETPWN